MKNQTIFIKKKIVRNPRRYKNTIIGTVQVSEHSLKLHFCMFERSQMKRNSLDCDIFLEYFPLIAKFTCSKLDTNK